MGKKVTYIGVHILFIVLSFVIVGSLFTAIVMLLIENGEEHLALISSMAQLVYLLLVCLILKLKKIDIKDKYDIRFVSYKELIIPAVLCFSYSAFSNICQSVLAVPQSVLGGTPEVMFSNIFSLIVSVLIIAPVVEEFIFRALIISVLRNVVSDLGAAFISALFFSVVHIMTGGFVIVIFTFIGGFIFGMIYIKTKSLLPAVVAHFFANLAGLFTMLTGRLPVYIQCIMAFVFFAVTVIILTKGIFVYRKETYIKTRY